MAILMSRFGHIEMLVSINTNLVSIRCVRTERVRIQSMLVHAHGCLDAAHMIYYRSLRLTSQTQAHYQHQCGASLYTLD
jgi:hypothetical protein